ncbi:MAG: potassium channel protein [Bryobacteraceae bacterium]
MTRTSARILTVLVLIAALLAVGTAGFVLLSGYPVFDALYMSVITITTVGYGEVHPLTRAGRIFNTFLLLVGAGVMAYAFSAVTQSIFESQFGDIIHKRRNRKMIDRLKNHYILCGFGRVGRGAAAELQRSGVPFVVMDKSEDRVERAIKMGMLAVQADSTRDDMLLEAGIQRACGLIAALSSDADNLFLILSAKSLNPNLVVSSRVSEEASESKMRRAGADAVFMPYSMTGYRLAQSILRPHVFQFLDVTAQTSSMGMDVGIEQVEIRPGADIASRSLKDMQLRRDFGVIVLAIRRSNKTMDFNPPADATVEVGDNLIVMGHYDDLRRLEKLVDGSRS